MNPLDFLLRNPTGRDAGSIARQRLNARAGMPVPGGAVPRGGILGPATAGVTLGEFVATPLAFGAANYLRSPQGQLVKDRLRQFDIPGAFTALTGIGRNSAPRLTPYNPPGFDPSKPVSTRDLLNTAREVGNITGRGLGGNAPAERAYQQELSRTAQLTAQDPELQRYERARSMAKTQEEKNAVRDEGMRIWAAKHGGLAANVKPGSTGYEAIQGARNPATASFLNDEQVLGTQSFDPNTVLSTAQQIQGQFRPNHALTDQEILAAQGYDPNIAMSSAGNIAFAPSSPTEAAMLKAVGGAQGEYITPMSTTTFANPLEQRKAIFQNLLNRAGARGK